MNQGSSTKYKKNISSLTKWYVCGSIGGWFLVNLPSYICTKVFGKSITDIATWGTA